MRLLRFLLFLTLLVLFPARSSPLASAAPAGADSPEARARCALGRLNLPAKVGQIMMVSIDGALPSRHTIDLLRTWQVGGIILFSRNIGAAADLSTLTHTLQRALPLGLLVATDQEGGIVARIQVGLTPLPAPAYYGQIGSADRVYADTRAQGLALRNLGINLNLAPVVDVRDIPTSAIGTRSFGPDPALDATLAQAAIRGYQSAGIGATAKHFLGLGEVSINADLALPVVGVSRATLEARDMVPMRAAVQAGVAALMVTRVVIRALDPTGTPAYASARMVQGIIRGELGYRGMIITDSLLTPSVLSGPGTVTAALAALRAGDDMLLLGENSPLDEPLIAAAISAVGQEVALGHIPLRRLNDAALHVLLLKARLGLLPRC